MNNSCTGRGITSFLLYNTLALFLPSATLLFVFNCSEPFLQQNVFSIVIFTFAAIMITSKINWWIWHEHSSIFRRLDYERQLVEVGYVCITQWAIYYLISNLVYMSYIFNNDTTNIFVNHRYLLYCLCMSFLLDQLFDLSVKPFNLQLYAHHLGEIALVFLILEWVPSIADPGVFILALQSGLDRVVYLPIVFTHLNHKANSFDKNELRPQQLDLFIIGISVKQVQAIYGYIFVFYAVIIRLFVAILLTVYMVLRINVLLQVWIILFPLLYVFFFLCDVDVYYLFYQRWRGFKLDLEVGPASRQPLSALRDDEEKEDEDVRLKL